MRQLARWLAPCALSPCALSLGALAVSALAPSGVHAQDPAASTAFRVVPEPTPPELASARAALREARPALRGFRAALALGPGGAADAQPLELDVQDASAPIVAAQAHVARQLAKDGLPATLVQVIGMLGPDVGAAQLLPQLARCGLPVDWLACFDQARDPRALVERVARALGEGRSAQDVRAELDATGFRFEPTVRGFQVATESGEHEVGLLRLQLTSGNYWAGEGDGGCLDVARQLAALLPGRPIVASIGTQHADAFQTTARAWPGVDAQRWTLLTQALPVAQWAQDNGKPGLVAAPDGSVRHVTLVPRYASRGEEGSVFVPGETFLIEGFAALGHAVVQSPLVFQGGDLIAVRHPQSGQRLLLLGEAEIYRNTALGLTAAQVAEVFRTEFGVERVIVLPALSFHIDYELCVRAVGQELVAFVNDSPAAVKLILSAGIQALEDHARVDAAQGRELRAQLAEGRWAQFVDELSVVLSKGVHRYGHFPEALAADFSSAPSDSGVGNLQTFLLAVDMLLSHAATVDDMPFDAHTLSYLKSFLRRDAQRAAFFEQLRSEGLRVVGVPSLAEAARGLNAINGIHEPGRYLMPAHGGLFQALDRAAASAFEAELGPGVQVVPISSSESQRRSGSLRCSVSVYPRS